MSLPTKIKLGGHTIKIVVKNDIEENADGMWSSAKNTIYIKESLPQSQREVTLVHEILHAINIVMNHEQVEFLAQTLYQVLADNKLHFGEKDGKK